MEGIGNPFGKHPMPHHSNQIHGHDPERVTLALLSAVHPPIGVTVGWRGCALPPSRVAVHAWMGTAAASISEPQELLMRKERKRELPYVFDPFRRAKTSDRSAAGLGLYIVSKISGARGGSVNVTSDEGGTTFTATLPKTRAPSSVGAP